MKETLINHRPVSTVEAQEIQETEEASLDSSCTIIFLLIPDTGGNEHSVCSNRSNLKFLLYFLSPQSIYVIFK